LNRALAAIIGAALALAQPAAAQVVPSGKPERHAPATAPLCVQCHGAQGEGIPSANFPRIAGQPEQYLAKQLEDYANGSRRNALMEPIAKALSRKDRETLAAYYAQLGPPVAKERRASGSSSERGEMLAASGDAQRRLQACNNCHGPGGAGRAPGLPYLAGLDAGYLAATLNAWKQGMRANDPGQQMAVIAKALSAEDVQAVAQYYASLSPPAPHATDAVRTPREARSEFVAGGDPERGRAILASGTHGCVACHAIPGIRGARGIAGPPLAGFARRGFIAGQLPNTPQVLVAFLLDPPKLVSQTGMPNVGLTLDEARHVAAFLHTLKAHDAR
jgi:cytochrome c553